MPGCEAILCGRRPSAPLALSLSKGRPFLHATSPFGLHTPCATLTLHPPPHPPVGQASACLPAHPQHLTNPIPSWARSP